MTATSQERGHRMNSDEFGTATNFRMLAAGTNCGRRSERARLGIRPVLLGRGLMAWDDILLCLRNNSDADPEGCLYALLKE